MVLCRPFVDIQAMKFADQLNFFTDSSANEKLGFGCVFRNRWTFSQWEPGYIKTYAPSIAYLELYALCVGIFTWRNLLKNCRIVVFCDNQSVVEMVNNLSSRCGNCMHLLRLLVLAGLKDNRRVFVKYIRSVDNKQVDYLSRMKLKSFFQVSPEATSKHPEPLPQNLWPASKL